jgi:uncharacterized protein (UPF0332 family)
MNFNWEKYLEFAEHVVNSSNSFPDKEACYRAAVSRAYYAAFCTTRGYIRKPDERGYDGGDAHKKVRDHLLSSGDIKKRTIANQLKKCHDNRIKADYYDNIRDSTLNLALQTVTISNNIIVKIKELNNNHVISG